MKSTFLKWIEKSMFDVTWLKIKMTKFRNFLYVSHYLENWVTIYWNKVTVLRTTWNRVLLEFIKDLVHVLLACMHFSCDLLKRETYAWIICSHAEWLNYFSWWVPSEKKMFLKLAVEWIYIVSWYPLLACVTKCFPFVHRILRCAITL